MLTYRALSSAPTATRAGRSAQNLAKGDTVGLMMPNRPEYLAIWLGITSVGGVVALINTNLRGASLAHCIDIAAPKHIIVAAELIERIPLGGRNCSRAGRRSGRTASDDFARIDREIERFLDRAADGGRAPRRDDRGSRAAHLHLRHHRPAEGGQCQPSPADAVELLVRRPDEHRARRPHVRLPADVSHRRRRGGDRSAAGPRRLGRDPRKIFRAEVLERYRRVGLHAVPVYRRALPLSCQRAGQPRERAHRLRHGLRQRAARRRLGAIPGAVRHSAHPGILCRDRRQRFALQRRGQGRRHRPRAAVSRAPLSAGAGQIRSHAAVEPARDADGFCVRCATDEIGEAHRDDIGGPRPAAAPSRAIPAPRRPSAKSCATCSSTATPGIAPAI